MITLSGAGRELAEELTDYDNAWQNLSKSVPTLDRSVTPTTISWKVASKAILFENLEHLAPQIEQIHIGTVNERYIASAVFHEPLKGQIAILKILERRQGSDDPLGLDSVDYLCRDLDNLKKLLIGQKVELQSNDMHDWLSLRFGPDGRFEAKFVDHLVLDVAIKELQLSSDKLLSTI